MPKPRYLFLSVDTPPNRGGVAELTYALSRALSKRSDQSVMIAPRTADTSIDTSLHLLRDFASEPKRRSGANAHYEDNRISDLVSKTIEAFKIDHLVLWHGFYYGPGAIRAARMAGCDSSIYVHGTELTSQFRQLLDLPEDKNEPDGFSGLRQRFLNTLCRADRVLTNSMFTQGLLQKLIPDASVHVIGCGIDRAVWERELDRMPAYSHEAKARARQEIGLPNRPTLCFLGRTVPHKHPTKVLDLLSHLPRAQLIIAGSGALDAEIDKKIAKRGLSDRVFCARDFSDAEKWQLLRASDIGFMPSGIDRATAAYEGFGIVMLEYTTAGCLAIGSGEHGLADFDQNRAPFPYTYGPLDDPRTFADTLSRLLNDTGEISRHVQKARDVIASHLLWDHVADRVEGTFRL